jgi:hypothetical protein
MTLARESSVAPQAASFERLIKQGACSAGNAVDLVEVSSFRNFVAVKDALHAPPPAVGDH